jgi:tetratricopeptide (TPR) repeat protein
MAASPENNDKTTSGAWQAVYSASPLATCNLQPATSALPCDAWHHHYHYQSSAQYLWLAETLAALEKPDGAVAAYDKAVFQDHLNVAAIEGKKKVAGRKLQVADVLQHAASYAKHPLLDAEFCISTGGQPDESTPFHDKAAGYYLAGDYMRALAILPVDILHGNSRFLRGKCWFRLKEYEKACEDLSEAVRLSHLRHDAYHRFASRQHFLRGERFLNEGGIDLAIAGFTRALDLHGGNKDARKARAAAYYAKGNIRLAQADESAA